jgi:hypothetical protein
MAAKNFMHDTNPCYDTAEQNTFARFETAEHGSFALPYNTLLCAHLTPATAGAAAQVLTLIFSTHTVTIEGAQLMSLLLAFQKARAEAVRVGGCQTSAGAVPAIRQIIVAEGISKNRV